mmetsp:Transcript_5348/g.6636  ORF Transcript_5348/g.6636 Transcript_5348/m.6636 type:complete len:115 (-) Transcript_5348:552-896(-)
MMPIFHNAILKIHMVNHLAEMEHPAFAEEDSAQESPNNRLKVNISIINTKIARFPKSLRHQPRVLHLDRMTMNIVRILRLVFKKSRRLDLTKILKTPETQAVYSYSSLNYEIEK